MMNRDDIQYEPLNFTLNEKRPVSPDFKALKWYQVQLVTGNKNKHYNQDDPTLMLCLPSSR